MGGLTPEISDLLSERARQNITLEDLMSRRILEEFGRRQITPPPEDMHPPYEVPDILDEYGRVYPHWFDARGRYIGREPYLDDTTDLRKPQDK